MTTDRTTILVAAVGDGHAGAGRAGAGQGQRGAKGAARRCAGRGAGAPAGEDRHAEAHPRNRRADDRRPRNERPVLVHRRAEAAAGLLGGPVPARRRRRSRPSSSCPASTCKFVPVSSSNRIPALLEGKIDLECGSTTNTRDRQKQVAFAYTTFVAGIKMLAKKSSNINSIEDLRGKTVVVTKGTTSEKMLRDAERRARAEDRHHRVEGPRRVVQGGRGRQGRRVPDGRRAALRPHLEGEEARRLRRRRQVPVGRAVRDHDAQGRAAVREARQPRADRALPVGRDPPALREVVQHEGPDGAAEPVPEGSVRRRRIPIRRGRERTPAAAPVIV